MYLDYERTLHAGMRRHDMRRNSLYPLEIWETDSVQTGRRNDYNKPDCIFTAGAIIKRENSLEGT
jgi:hypothetical protein